MKYFDLLLEMAITTIAEGIIKVPIPKVEQVSNYDCGPAALRAICEYYKVGPKSHDEFIKDCEATKKDGTEPENLIAVAKKYGLKTKAKRGMTIEQLEVYLDQGRPVIVDLQAWGQEHQYKKLDSGHYVVAIGYDDDTIYFEDPSVHTRKRGKLSKKDLKDRWKDKKANGEKLTHYAIAMWKETDSKDTDSLSSATEIE